MHDNHDFDIISPLEKNNTEDIYFGVNPLFEAEFNDLNAFGDDELNFFGSIFENPDLEKKGNFIVGPPTPMMGEITKTTVVDIPVIPSPEQYERRKLVTKKSGCESKKNRDFRLKESVGEWTATKVNGAYRDYDVTVQLRTRTEGPTDFVPEIMYSSIQYVVLIDMKANEDFDDAHPFYAKVFLHDAVTGKRLTHDLNNRAPVRGDFEGAVSKKLDGDFKGELKVKFGDLSYNKNPTEYRIVVELYDPKDLNTSLIEIETDNVRIYARKPNKKKSKKKKSKKKKKSPPKKKTKKNKKRKRNTDDDEEDENPRAAKKRKFDAFKNKLDEMINVFGKLEGNDRNMALDMLMNVVNEDELF